MSVTISGSGQIIKQVIQTVKSDTFSTNSTLPTFAAVTGLSASITPTSASNKIMVIVNLSCSMSADYVFMSQITRNGTAIDVGDAAGSRTRATIGGYQGGTGITYQSTPQNIIYLDSPATTSAVTYTIQIASENAGGTIYVNRTANDTDAAARGRFSSTITVMEVAYA